MNALQQSFLGCAAVVLLGVYLNQGDSLLGGEREGIVKYDDCREIVRLKDNPKQKYYWTFTCTYERTVHGKILAGQCARVDLPLFRSGCDTAYVYEKQSEISCWPNSTPTYDEHCRCNDGYVWNDAKKQCVAFAARKSSEFQFTGHVSVAQWWSEVVTVPEAEKTFEVTLSWPGANDTLDLHLVSPSGHHYGWYGDTTGYSGAKTNPQVFSVPKPEPGLWRISVEGVHGSGPIEFGVETSGRKPSL